MYILSVIFTISFMTGLALKTTQKDKVFIGTIYCNYFPINISPYISSKVPAFSIQIFKKHPTVHISKK